MKAKRRMNQRTQHKHTCYNHPPPTHQPYDVERGARRSRGGVARVQAPSSVGFTRAGQGGPVLQSRSFVYSPLDSTSNHVRSFIIRRSTRLMRSTDVHNTWCLRVFFYFIHWWFRTLVDERCKKKKEKETSCEGGGGFCYCGCGGVDRLWRRATS